MPVIPFGSKMKSPFLEQWRPEPGTLTTISILSLDPIGTRSHWVDLPEISVKDRCKCVESFCCKAFGPSWITYYFPIWVYDKTGLVGGTFFIFAVTPSQYHSIVNLAQAGDLLTFDLQVHTVKQGTGYQSSYTLMPNSTLRASMPEEMKVALTASIADFYKEEEKLCRSMTEESYTSMLQKVRYDFASGLPIIKKSPPAQPNPGSFQKPLTPVPAPVEVTQLPAPPVNNVGGSSKAITPEELQSMLT